jgi:hypothetical protein
MRMAECGWQNADGSCATGHRPPQKMRCIDFTPSIERFCATPADYTGLAQFKQMALFFGFAGKELQRALELGSKEINKPATG